MSSDDILRVRKYSFSILRCLPLTKWDAMSAVSAKLMCYLARGGKVTFRAVLKFLNMSSNQLKAQYLNYQKFFLKKVLKKIILEKFINVLADKAKKKLSKICFNTQVFKEKVWLTHKTHFNSNLQTLTPATFHNIYYWVFK